MTTKRVVIFILGVVGLFTWAFIQDLIDSLHKRLGEQEQTIVGQRRTILEKDSQIEYLEGRVCKR